MPGLDPSVARVDLRPRYFDRIGVLVLMVAGGMALLFAALSPLTVRPTPPGVHPMFGASPHAAWLPLSVLGLVLIYCGLRWWDGWHAELDLDPARREITIHRSPRLLPGSRVQKFAARELRLTEAVEWRSTGRGGRSRFVRFELRDTRGKQVFKYTTMYDPGSKAELDGYLQMLGAFFAQP